LDPDNLVITGCYAGLDSIFYFLFSYSVVVF